VARVPCVQRPMKFRSLTDSIGGATLLSKVLAQTNETKVTLILTLTLALAPSTLTLNPNLTKPY